MTGSPTPEKPTPDKPTPDKPTDDPLANLAALTAHIADAAEAAGRRAEDITLIGVSKVHGPERIEPVLNSGHRHYGENRVQEAAEKWPSLRETHPGITLHLIGPLQTNKVKEAVRLFDVFHALDREKLARKLAETMEAEAKSLPCFIQVNTGEEPQKAGVLPADVDGFVKTCRETYGLTIEGLMCIPPVDEEPAMHFALLEKMAARNGLTGLSMGMTGDFETAIAYGATHLRVGSALFGERPTPPARSTRET